MTRRITNRISLLIIVVGFAAAAAIYLAAEPAQSDSLLDDPWGRRRYAHDMKVMGGPANLLMADLQDWFEAQWRGEALARSVVFLTIGATLLFRFGASFPPNGKPPETAAGAGPRRGKK